MRKLSFYEQVGIVIPGSVFLFGLIYYIPALRTVLSKDGISLGGLGVFILLAYAAGHLVAALGNALETFLWWNGMPSDWVTKPPPNIISKPQAEQLSKQLKARLGIELATVVGMDRKSWGAIARQMYADVERHGKPKRIEAFNGNYGLNRGLCSATLALTAVALVQRDWYVAITVFVISAVYLYRARRFAVHYGRELFVQFLQLSATRTTTDARPRSRKREPELRSE